MSEETVLIGTAIVVGAGAGIGAVVVQALIDAIHWIGFVWIPEVTRGLGRAYVFFIPLIGGLVVGPMVYFFAREAKGHGVPEVMAAIALRGGRIRPVVAVVKALASAFTIGSGGSAGREGPMVQIGSALGSTLGQVLHLSDDRIRNLVACGAAAGIAATFHAPIAGVIFALEVILGEFSVGYFSTVVLSSVVASVIGRAAFGDIPAFPLITEYGVNSVWEYAFYPFLGVLAGLVGFAFVRVLYRSEDLFDGWKGVPEWVKPAVGGGLLGLLALIYPEVTDVSWETVPHIFNVGYDVIIGALSNELVLGTVLTLMFLKLIATSLTLGSGGSGGVFAPSLFMGAMLGTAFQLVLQALFPGIPAPPGAYALVGMAAVFAASAHAPITAIIILMELTDDTLIILPLMLTVIVATFVARALLNNQSIYTLKLTRRGIHLRRGRDIDILQAVTVQEVMTSNMHTVPSTMTLSELAETFSVTHHHGFPVLDGQGHLWGIVTVTDLDRAFEQHVSGETTLDHFATPRPQLVVAFPDEPIGEALGRMGGRGLGRMPVVRRDNPGELIGMIRRADIIRAYNIALARRTRLQNRTKLMAANHPEGTEIVEVTLSADSPVVGKPISEVAPNLAVECVLISVQRRGHVLIPHGDTVFQVGDHLMAFVHNQDAEALRTSLLMPEPVTDHIEEKG